MAPRYSVPGLVRIVPRDFRRARVCLLKVVEWQSTRVCLPDVLECQSTRVCLPGMLERQFTLTAQYHEGQDASCLPDVLDT